MSYVERKAAQTGSIFGPIHPSTAPAHPEALPLRPAFRRRSRNGHDSAQPSLTMHNLVFAAHRTTARLEPAIWDALQFIARRQEITAHNLIPIINRDTNASSPP